MRALCRPPSRINPMMSCEFATVRFPPSRLSLRRSGRMRSRPSPTTTTTAATFARCASSRRDDAEELSSNGGGGGRLVDEGMAVLRRRIHEMEAAERGGGWEPHHQPPQESAAAWEEEWYDDDDDDTYDGYDADDVNRLVGVLQAFLVNSFRGPGVAVGLVAALVLAVPAASAFVLVKLFLDASRAIISNLHAPLNTDDDETDNVHIC